MTDEKPIKVCPVVYREVYRESVQGIELLAFKHPLAGKQWVKGSIERFERPLAAALRELKEESGLTRVMNIVDLGVHFIHSGALGEAIPWQLYVAKSSCRLPDSWDYLTEDDQGHVFSFFWQPANEALTSEWHPMYHEVFTHIRCWLMQKGIHPAV